MTPALRERWQELEGRLAEGINRLLEDDQVLRAVVDGFPGYVFVKDLSNNILACNEAMAISAGRTPSECVGQSVTELWPEATDVHYLANDWEVARTGKPKLNIVEKFWHQTLGVRVVLTDKKPFVSNGRVVGIIGFARDITDIPNRVTALLETADDGERRTEDEHPRNLPGSESAGPRGSGPGRNVHERESDADRRSSGGSYPRDQTPT